MAIPNQNLFAFRTYSSPAGAQYTPFNSYSAFQVDWWFLTYASPSVSSLATYYANLLILQYLGKPKAFAEIEALVTPIIMDLLPNEVQDGYNLLGASPAVGVQLDILGKYQNVTRSGYGFNGPITLDDTDFLTLIQIATIRNNAGSSLATIQALIFQFFSGQIYVFDYANMNMSYLINTSIGSQNLIDLFVNEGLLPKPMGVGLSVIAAPIINMFFALRTYQAPASSITNPLNTYASFQSTWLILTYADAIVPLT